MPPNPTILPRRKTPQANLPPPPLLPNPHGLAYHRLRLLLPQPDPRNGQTPRPIRPSRSIPPLKGDWICIRGPVLQGEIKNGEMSLRGGGWVVSFMDIREIEEEGEGRGPRHMSD